MFLSKHTNGVYYIYYTTSDGRRLSKTTKTKFKSDANKALIKFANEFKEKNSAEVKPINLKKFSFEFLYYAECMLSWKTTLTYKTTFNAMLKYFGDIPLSNFSTQNVLDYIQHITRTVSIYAARKDLINIKAAFNKAVQDKYMLANPAKTIKSIKVPEKLPVFFSRDELSKLLKVLPDQDWKDLVEFAVNTGLRQAELLTMRKRQYDSVNKIIILDNQHHITKSRKVRTVPLNNNAATIIERRCNSKTDLLFTFNGEQINQDYLIHKFKRYIKDSGVNAKLNFHSLRHTFASWLVQSGASIYTVSKLLGHASIKTTEIYAHLSMDDLRRVVDFL